MIKRFNQFFLRPENIALLIVLIIATFMRLYRLKNYLVFLGDEGRDVLVVRHILQGDLTFLGPTASVGGFFLGPIYYYFMVPFLFLFNYDPVGPAVMVALFGVATVWLLYKVAKEFFGIVPAFVAALLYAISPLVIVYSRSSWNPNIVPFFTLLAMYTLYKAGEKKSIKLYVVLGVLLGILLQLHYLTTFLGLIIGAYVLCGIFSGVPKKITVRIVSCLKFYVAIFIGFIIGWSPFLVFEIKHGLPNIRSIFEFVFKSQETGAGPGFVKIISDVIFRLFGRLLVSFPEASQLSRYPANEIKLWEITVFLVAIVCVGGIVLSVAVGFKKHRKDTARQVLLLLWLVIGIGMFGLYKKINLRLLFWNSFSLTIFIACKCVFNVLE